MATLRDILNKIGAVKKTRQITRAMNMVAASKLRTTRSKLENFEPYARKFSEVLENLAGRVEPGIHPLLVGREHVSRVELLHFSSDRGLCGSFNTNMIAMGEKWRKDQEDRGRQYGMTLVGKKGIGYFQKRDCNITATHTSIYGKVDIAFVNQLTKNFIDMYMENEVDEVYMIYSRFLSMMKQTPTVVKLIPIEPPQNGTDGADSLEYLYEPSAEDLLIDLLPKHISVQIFRAFIQNEGGEHAARMVAMDNATKNCSEMVDDLTLVYNKARQAAITADLMDIVGGAEALK